mgnify:CR=1 FL=1
MRFRLQSTRSYASRMKNGRYNIDLCAHMAECDATYLRLIKLMPALHSDDERVIGIGIGEGGRTVRFEVVERSRYTSVVAIEVEGESDHARSETTDNPRHLGPMSIRVRLYHDARSAEVIEMQKQRRFEPVYDYPNPKMRARDEKAQVNRYLSEFLANCLSHGVSREAPMGLSGELLTG